MDHADRRPLEAPDLTLDDFVIEATDKIRYADTDRQGHVNNAAFATFLETGRVEVLYDPKTPLALEGGAFVIAKLELSFRAERRCARERMRVPEAQPRGGAKRTVCSESKTNAGRVRSPSVLEYRSWARAA